MISKFEQFSKNKINAIHLTKIMQTDQVHMLYEYWDEKDTPYSDDYYFQPDWLYQYLNKMPLSDAIESNYLSWKSDQHRLTPIYEILHSLVPLLKYYSVTMQEDDNQFKKTCKCSNGFVIYNDKVLIFKIEVINNITDYIIPVYFCQKH